MEWPSAGDWPDATTIARFSAATCHAYLDRHRVRFRALPGDTAPEVEQPIRLQGPIAGVTFAIPWSKDLENDPHAIWDCRLAAAMLPVAHWFRAHSVREVHYFSVLRRGPRARRRPRSRHNVGLAIDVLGVRIQGQVERRDVDDHFPPGVLRGCPAAFWDDPDADPALVMWTSLVCHAWSRAWLHTVLTPDYDRAHRNHLHLDLDPRQTVPADPFVSFATSGGQGGK